MPHPPKTAIRPSPLRVAVASMIGTTIEWYDYYIYGAATVLVFNSQFFPSLDPLAATLAGFATFSVSYLARPLGGAFFGHFGDIVGRKRMLVLSVLLMGFGTLAVGLLPTYATIGVAAPILLVVCRFLQGFAVGGEWGGAVLVALEHAPPSRRAFFASFPQVGVPLGTFLSSGTFALVTSLPHHDVTAWAWRIPFYCSTILVAIALWIRLRITETPEFERLRRQHEERQQREERRIPIRDLFRRHKRALLAGVLSPFPNAILFYIVTVFLLSYGHTHVGATSRELFIALMIAAGIAAPLLPVIAGLGDRIGPKRALQAGALVILLFAFPLFWMFDTGSFLGIVTAMVLGLAVLHNLYYGVLSSFIAGLFPAEVRYTGTSLSYQLGQILTAAPVPIVATLLATLGNSHGVSLYIMAAGLIGMIAVSTSPRGMNEPAAPVTAGDATQQSPLQPGRTS
jgi:metabolite-proton symporter